MTHLQQYRDRSKLSRSKLGARAGIDPQTIYKLERGSKPQLSTAVALSIALSEALGEEVSVMDLFPNEIAEASA